MLLMQAQENRVALDEERLLFMVGGQDNAVDKDVDEQPVQDLALIVDNVFQANDCDAFDSDVDEAPTTQTTFMANLSFANPIYNEAGSSYDSNILSEGISNMIPYDQYGKGQAVIVVQKKVGYWATRFLYGLTLLPKQVQPALYNGHEIIKTNHVPAIVHNSEDTLEIAEITRKKMNEKMKDPECVKKKVKIAPHDYSKENYLATFTPQTQLTPEQIFWSKDLIKMKAEALKEQTPASRPIKALTVYPPNTPATLVPRVLPTKKHFEGIQKALTKEVKEMKEIFEELEAEVDQNVVNRKYDEIERKNLLIANGNLIVDCLSKDVFYIAINSELTALDFQITQLTDKVIVLQEQNELFRTKNAKIKQHYKELYDSIKITLLATGRYAIDVEPIPPRNRNNREVHLDYLKHLKESVETLREIVEEAKIYKVKLDECGDVLKNKGSPEYKDTAGSGGKKEPEALVFHKMYTEEDSDRDEEGKPNLDDLEMLPDFDFDELLEEIWADKVRLDGMIKPEEEKAMAKMKGKMLKGKKDPGAFTIGPIILRTASWKTEDSIEDLMSPKLVRRVCLEAKIREEEVEHFPKYWFIVHTIMRSGHPVPNALEMLKPSKKHYSQMFTTNSWNGEVVVEKRSKVRYNLSLKEAQSDEEIFFSVAWVRAFNIREPIYPELCHEFYAIYGEIGFYHAGELNEDSQRTNWIEKDSEAMICGCKVCLRKTSELGMQRCMGELQMDNEKKGSWKSEGQSDLLWTTLRELIDSEDRLIPDIPVDDVPRVAAQRAPRVQRASMQDLYERMGSMEIRQEAIERMEYKHAYHWDRYQGVFEHMAGVYNVLLPDAYNLPGYAQP
ncbi:hypothetical protein Tco_1219451 [Tanacetum coccineum]